MKTLQQNQWIPITVRAYKDNVQNPPTKELYTLPETNIFWHLKIDAWKTSLTFLGFGLFAGVMFKLPGSNMAKLWMIFVSLLLSIILAV